MCLDAHSPHTQHTTLARPKQNWPKQAWPKLGLGLSWTGPSRSWPIEKASVSNGSVGTTDRAMERFGRMETLINDADADLRASQRY